ncbi:MAG: hypothetical protein ACLQUW_10550 [Desulfobaccales bacterium]
MFKFIVYAHRCQGAGAALVKKGTMTRAFAVFWALFDTLRESG